MLKLFKEKNYLRLIRCILFYTYYDFEFEFKVNYINFSMVQIQFTMLYI